jgi:hypothetical protein
MMQLCPTRRLVLAQADAGRLQLETKSLVLPLALAPQLDDLDALCDTRGLGLSQRWEENMVGWGDGRRLAVIFQNLAINIFIFLKIFLKFEWHIFVSLIFLLQKMLVFLFLNQLR